MEPHDPARSLHRVSLAALVGLSLTALLDVVLLGYMRPPLHDEGTGAHVFQLAIVALLPAGAAFLATADWTQPARILKRLTFPAIVVIATFIALYYLENIFYPAHYPAFYR